MRIVLIGLNHMSLEAARQFMDNGDDVILIDPDREAFESVADELDIAFIQGDGAKPDILKEANPSSVDVMYCLADDDKENIIAALVGRATGVNRVIPKIANRSYDPICDEIGLAERIDPDHSVAKSLVRMSNGEGNDLDADEVESDDEKEKPAGR